MSTIRAGRLKHRLYAQRQTTTQDAAGQPANTWSALFDRKFAIEPLNGREYLSRSGENADITVRLRCRYDASTKTLKPYDRLVDTSVSPQVVYDIESVINPKQGNRELVLMCRQ